MGYSGRPMRRWTFAGILLWAPVVVAQSPSAFAISGRILEDVTGRSIVGATVTIEARDAHAFTDSLGRFTIRRLAPGAVTIRAQRLGWAPSRTSVLLFDRDVSDVILRLARSALSLREMRVTADRNGQVNGELGTGTVIDRDAIRTLGAASLAGILELVPGTVLQPPGLDGRSRSRSEPCQFLRQEAVAARRTRRAGPPNSSARSARR